jgi:hypothetical protein
VVRGTPRWGSLLAVVLSGLVGLGVLPAGGAEPLSYQVRVDAVAYHLPVRLAASRCGEESLPSIPR